MRVPSNSELIAIWERGSGEHPVERALTLLCACGAQSRDELARLPIGARDALLLRAYERLFGPELRAFAECPACKEPLEYTLSTQALLAPYGSPAADGSGLTLQEGSLSVRLRLPDSLDLRAAVACPDTEVAARLLAERCVMEATLDGQTVVLADLPAHIPAAISAALAAADPGAEILIALNCAVCTHAWQVIFDIERFLWAKVSATAKRLLRDVHALASAYGWPELDILALSASRRQNYVEMACPTS